MKYFVLAILFATLPAQAASHQPKAEDDEGKLVKICSNHEATYEFYANDDGKIEYAIVKQKPYPNQRIECSSRSRGSVTCKEQYEANELTLDGNTAVMHFNTDNDSNNDGEKARCTNP